MAATTTIRRLGKMPAETNMEENQVDTNQDQDNSTQTTQTPVKASSEFMETVRERCPDLYREVTAEETPEEVQAREEKFARYQKQQEEEQERRDWEAATEKARFDASQKALSIKNNLHYFARAIGKRYVGCTFDNFKTPTQEMVDVKKAVVRYGKNIEARLEAGHGVVLFGPSGTGKDHLLIALGFVAAKLGRYVKWKNVPQFLEDLDSNRGFDCAVIRERLILSAAEPDILILADLVPPMGSLNQQHSTVLLRIIDERYRERLPTWVSMNVKNAEEAAARMGAAIVDRLKHDALTCFCNWPSYRANKGA